VTSLSGVYIVYSRNERLLNGRLWREAALREAQAELARVTRVTTLGELTASIAHEVNQPLATVVTLGDASLRWLDREVPRIDKARSAVEQMIGSARHASDVIQRIRALSKKGRVRKRAARYKSSHRRRHRADPRGN
jgi:C4-dicarboxylate-specific signal transduction histidine kinase